MTLFVSWDTGRTHFATSENGLLTMKIGAKLESHSTITAAKQKENNDEKLITHTHTHQKESEQRPGVPNVRDVPFE